MKDRFGDFGIKKLGENHHILFNKKIKNRKNHTHLHTRGTCECFRRLILNEIVPDSSYLKDGVKYLSRNESYKKKCCK